MRSILASNGHATRQTIGRLGYSKPAAIALPALLVALVAWVGLSRAFVDVGVARSATSAPNSFATACAIPTFGPVTNFGVGTSPRSVAAGDFNQDGNLDLATANLDSNDTSILLGNGTGGFDPATHFEVGSSPRSVIVAAVDGDSSPDLAVANYNSNTVSILLGNGNGGFGAASDFAVGAGPYYAAVGFFNNDSHTDLVAANAISNSVSMLLGDGSGSFGPAVDFGVGFSPRSVVVGAFNEDGHSDLAVANFESNNISILLGDGNGSFGTATNFAVGMNPLSLASGDFNEDSNLDLAVINYQSDTISILLGDGGGGFSPPANYGVGTAPRWVSVGDFNLDSALDLAVANGLSNNVSILLGNGGGGFGAAYYFAVGTAPFSVAVGDFNQDTRPDLATANFAANTVSVRQNTCAGETPTPASSTPTDTTTPIATDTPGATATATATGTATAECNPWSRVTSPNPGPTYSQLLAVAAVSPNDAWAVGVYYDCDYCSREALILHWNGSAWSVVPIPIEARSGSFNGITALSANDVWAVGETDGSYNVLHWDGSTWSVIPVPSEMRLARLVSVSFVSAADGWAVGTRINHAFTAHWDGSAWTVVPSPNPGTVRSFLFDVKAVSTNDVWAAGSYDNSIASWPMTLHWDGTAWSLMPLPYFPPHGEVNGLAAFSASDVWGVGYYGDYGALALHWDGTEWEQVRIPRPVASGRFQSIAFNSHNDGWASGLFDLPLLTTHLLHWDGSAWREAPDPPLEATFFELFKLDFSSPDDGWAVGYSREPGVDRRTLTLRYAPCPFQPSPTPTACPLQFTDVPPAHTFYPFIRCLACRQVVSGYADLTFHPEYDVTRGQIAKIVSNSAGFTEAHDVQTFVDIPLTHTFYIFIERLATRGIIQGYPCGGPGEPCPGMYFRPNSNATRGQIAKIVCVTYLCVGPPTSQTFEDVLPGHTFYTDIERLYALNAIGGYPCGSPEPCVPPLNRPYFRPGNNVSRGQTTKIVANVFFPGCYTPFKR